MPPKPQKFVTPDGKEFSSRAEWRDYMMLTFYSFKNKNDEAEPLMKLPGSIEGQMFDIADCKNSTLLVLDQTEQVQIDQLVGCRVFIAACASSIFIRNCSNCTFYTCCRQLRLRDVTNCNFYIYSMSEVHIEYTNNVRFAPFNGGYPDHLKHLQAANLDINHNLWYDIYDHNDPGKTNANWSLIPEVEYASKSWFPLGECDRAIPMTKPNSVQVLKEDTNMQAFSIQQMIQDAQKVEKVAPKPAVTVSDKAPATVESVIIDEAVLQVLKTFTSFKVGETLKDIATADFQVVLPEGNIVSLQDYEVAAPLVADSLESVVSFIESAGKDLVIVVFTVRTATGQKRSCTATFVKQSSGSYKLRLVQKS